MTKIIGGGDLYHWRRIRSPCCYGRTSASINSDGSISVRGNGVYGKPRDDDGIRTALWLKLDDSIENHKISH